MRLTRQIFAVALLALYVAQVVGGQALHMALHLSAGDACCGESLCQVGEKPAPRRHRHSHGHCQHHGHRHGGHEHGHHEHADHAEHTETEQQAPTQDDNHRHDPSSCSICQILGQAQDTPVDLEVAASAVVVPATVLDLPEFYPSVSRSGFHSRAPPLLQA